MHEERREVIRQKETLRALAEHDGNPLPAIHKAATMLSDDELHWLTGELIGEMIRRKL